MKNPVRVYYIGKRDGEKHDCILTAATEVQDNGTLRIGLSFCSRKDRFQKSIGRTKALGRMNSNSAHVVMFSGNSADDVAELVNSNNIFHGKETVIKPNVWQHRKIVRPQGSGLTYVKM